MSDIDFVTIDHLKARLPVTYVLHVAGHEPVDRHARDILYRVPWRSDSDPSLACYPTEDGGTVDRWSDNARNESGDVLDLIQRLDPSKSTHADRLAFATRILRKLEADETWTAPEPIAGRGSFDLEAAKAEMQTLALNAEDNLDVVTEFLLNRDAPFDAQWLFTRFGVAAQGNTIVAPYGDTGLYKYRRPDDKFKMPGGTSGMWTTFYGQEHDDGTLPVVLCEGETDVWSGTHAAGQDYVFLGVPTGAGTRPEKLQSRLAGRRVLIAFDGDPAGRDAVSTWAEALAGECAVEIVPVPEGKDLAGVRDIPGLLRLARPFTPELPGLLVVGGRLTRASKDGTPGAPIADFVLDPVRVLHDPDGGLNYEVTDGRNEYLLLASDLLTKNAMRRWASDRGLVWDGSDNDVAKLSSRLKARSIFCPSETASDIAGLFDGHFVWDGGSIGDRPMRYVPPAIRARLDIRVQPGRGDARLIHVMRELNDHRITDPILAWTAAAVYRSVLPQFPVLNVAGTSGSGKTTTVRAIIPTLTGSHVFQTLSSSTPFAVEGLIHSTNAFPVVFDEYRPGARSATLERLEQLARDAYDGQPSAKSSGGDRWNELAYIRTDAPIVIAGEQSITETSHAERMILVHITRPKVRDDRHRQALRFVEASQDGELAHRFLTWVVRDGLEVKHTPEGPEELGDRVRYNIGVLDLGWRILNDFLVACGQSPMGQPDWSGVINTVTEVASEVPTLEALEWALGDDHASANVWYEDEDDELCVSVPSFLADVKRNGTFTLPGNNARTITDQLVADYGATTTKRIAPLAQGGRQRRVVVVPAWSTLVS